MGSRIKAASASLSGGTGTQGGKDILGQVAPEDIRKERKKGKEHQYRWHWESNQATTAENVGYKKTGEEIPTVHSVHGEWGKSKARFWESFFGMIFTTKDQGSGVLFVFLPLLLALIRPLKWKQLLSAFSRDLCPTCHPNPQSSKSIVLNLRRIDYSWYFSPDRFCCPQTNIQHKLILEELSC